MDTGQKVCVGFICVLLLPILLSMCAKMTGGGSSSSDTSKDRENGFHCLSSWSGSNRSVVNRVKSSLHNPASFEHVNTSVARVAGGAHEFVMKFRAENAFGAVRTSVAVGEFYNSGCEVKSVQIVE